MCQARGFVDRHERKVGDVRSSYPAGIIEKQSYYCVTKFASTLSSSNFDIYLCFKNCSYLEARVY